MRKRILFLEGNVDGTVGGSYYVMIDLVNALDKTRYDPVIGFHTDNILVPKLREAGIEVVIFDNPQPFLFKNRITQSLPFKPLKRTINFFKRLILPAIRYSKYIKKNNIDLVNVNNSIIKNHAWMIAARLAGIPCVSHEMGINKSFRWSAQYFGKRLNAVICVSNIIETNMRKLGLDWPHISTVHNGLDISRYHIKETPDQLRSKYNIDEKDPVIGVVGNIKYWKGQETIVRATAELVKKYPNIRCILVGAVPVKLDGGDYKNNLDNLCREFNIERNVIFTDFQENPIDYMNLMDIVVHTSVDPEPFGIVLLEAMLLSKPLISTTIGGPAEIVVNNKSGVLIQPGDPKLLATAVDNLLSDPEQAQEIGKQGYKRLMDEFTIEKNAEKTMKIYKSILGV